MRKHQERRFQIEIEAGLCLALTKYVSLSLSPAYLNSPPPSTLWSLQSAMLSSKSCSFSLSPPVSSPLRPRFLPSRALKLQPLSALDSSDTRLSTSIWRTERRKGCDPVAASSPTMNSAMDEAVEGEIGGFLAVANRAADAAGEVLRNYFRQSFQIIDKEDLSPVTIADREAEESMVSIIAESFPSHAVFGEENGWRCKEKTADYVWVLDPIDGTKSFITGKPLFGTLIALLHKGKPIIGIIDQPILRERWIGVNGRKTTLNGREVSTRSCGKLSNAYLYTTSPHLFSGDAEEAFIRVRNKPYDFLSLVPVIEGAGGLITDWRGHKLHWEASSESHPTSFNVLAGGDSQVHKQALDVLKW